MSSVKFYIVDVFAPKKYAGNQLAVFVDLKKRLTSEMMLQMTREINFAESTFITAKNDDGSFDVRIFTTEYEVPFAGHPTLGTAYILAKYFAPRLQERLVLRLKKGDIPVEISKPRALEDSRFTMRQAQPDFGKTYDHGEVAELLDIPTDTLDNSKPIFEISTGLPYLIIFLRDLKTIKALKLQSEKLERFLKKHNLHKINNPNGLTTSFFLVCEETVHEENDYHTRMFVLEDEKVWEDAATGSANGCLLAYLLQLEQQQVSAIVEQGFEMGRNSILYLDGKLNNSEYQLNVGGQVIPISEGSWTI